MPVIGTIAISLGLLLKSQDGVACTAAAPQALTLAASRNPASPTAAAIWMRTGRAFAASLEIEPARRVCGPVTVEMRVTRGPGRSAFQRNDMAYIHMSNGVPNASGLSPALAAQTIWEGEAEDVRTKVLVLRVEAAVWNRYVPAAGLAYLDIVAMDDTAVGSVKVSW